MESFFYINEIKDILGSVQDEAADKRAALSIGDFFSIPALGRGNWQVISIPRELTKQMPLSKVRGTRKSPKISAIHSHNN